MLLAIDVSNTNIKAAVYPEPARGGDPLVHWRISTDRHKTADEYGILFAGLFAHRGLSAGSIDAVAISCVVPPLVETMERLAREYFGIAPLMAGPGVQTGMRILYENPREAGTDRICNAVAAFAKYGGPAIIVDFGTATTFTAISREGDFLGGAIAPGIGISVDALAERTAQLRRVELVKPASVIGRNTVAAMQSGILYGFVGQVEEIVRRMKQELGGEATVIAVGGWAEFVLRETTCVDHHDPLLTLDGLRILYVRSRGETGG